MTLSTWIPSALMMVGASLAFMGDARAQTAPLESYTIPQVHDTGWVAARQPGRQVVASFTVTAPGSDWVRLYFDRIELAGNPKLGTGAEIRITSHLDGDMQMLNAITAEQWQNSSCYLNGDTVQVDVIASMGAGLSRVVLREVDASVPVQESICGAVDDRVPSSDPRSARLLPVGCTGWIIDDCNHCFLTAGHCSTSASSVQVVQFNVPPSNANGSLNQPPAADQYPADTASRQSNGGQGVGDDWAYFGAFPNSNTGLTPAAAQGSWFSLGVPGTGTPGDIRITGYGTDSTPLTRNQVQQSHAGPWVTNSGTVLSYRADTTGGNSGSPVIRESTGEAIGIHTHGGCSASGGQNNGTSVVHSSLQQALANPQGICSCGPGGGDDSFEENDTCTQAAPLTTGTYTGLLAVGADLDYFAVSVPAGATLTVDCLFTHASGDLDMQFLDATCANQISISQSTSDNEQLVWTNAGGSTATIKVLCYYYQGAGTNGYDLMVDVSGGGGGGCTLTDDVLEDNDDCGQEIGLGNGTYSGLVASKTDWDYFAFQVAPGSTLSVDLSFTHADGDLDMFLYAAGTCEPFSAGNTGCTGTIACGFSGTDNESISYVNASGSVETVVLKVNVYPPTSTGDCNQYTMQVQGADPGSIGVSYCDVNPNSTGVDGNLAASGSQFAADNNLTLTVSSLPLNTFGFIIVSPTQVFVPNVSSGPGNLCVGPSIGRGVGGVIFNSGASGSATVTADLTAMPSPTGPTVVMPGDTLNFQGWHRDTMGGSLVSNFTTAVSLFFL